MGGMVPPHLLAPGQSASERLQSGERTEGTGA